VHLLARLETTKPARRVLARRRRETTVDADAVATQPWTEQENRRSGTPLRNQHGRRTTGCLTASVIVRGVC